MFLDRMAQQANTAWRSNDLFLSCKTVRLLAGKSASHMMKAVKNTSGVIVSEAHGVKLIWQGHFAHVFGAPVQPISPDLFPPPRPKGSVPSVVFSYNDVQRHILGLGKNKGIGLDANEAEVLQAGETPLSRYFTT